MRAGVKGGLCRERNEREISLHYITSDSWSRAFMRLWWLIVCWIVSNPCGVICTRRARTWACTRTSACMHFRVIAACLLTMCPRTTACNRTRPFKARKALLACPSRRTHECYWYLKEKRCSMMLLSSSCKQISQGKRNLRERERKFLTKNARKTVWMRRAAQSATTTSAWEEVEEDTAFKSMESSSSICCRCSSLNSWL